VTSEHIQEFFDILKPLSAKQRLPPAEIESLEDAEPKKALPRSSLLAFKEVDEICVSIYLRVFGLVESTN
jgi:hypothetical protein